MAYALTADLQTFMGATLDPGKAALVLQMVADSIDKFLGLDPETYGAGSITVGPNTYTGAALSQSLTGVILDGPPQGSSLLVVPGHPVTAIAQVQVQDVLGTWTPLVYQQDYLWSTSGILTRIRNSLSGQPVTSYWPGPPLGQIGILPLTPIWPAIPQGVKVDFTRGFTTVPATFRTVSLTAGARVYANPTGVTGENIGGYAVRYSPRADGGVGGVDLNSLEQATLTWFMESVVG